MLSFQVLSYSPVNNFWLLGDSFLRSTYSIYDVTNGRIGFVADFAKYRGSDALDPLTTLLPLLMLCCCIGGVFTTIVLVTRIIKRR